MKTKPKHIEYNKPFTQDSTVLRFVGHPSYGLRFAGFADVLAKAAGSRRIEHTGWYTDEFQDRTLRGVVYRLPHGRLVAGYASSDDCKQAKALRGTVWLAPEGACLSFDDIATETDDGDTLAVAILADQLAESAAEAERDYNEAWQAGREFSELGDDIKAAWRALKRLARERWQAQRIGSAGFPALCEAVQAKAADLFDQIEAYRARRAELAANAANAEAFREGAGE